jgi:DNA-binding NarL/FixJ family response regulator
MTSLLKTVSKPLGLVWLECPRSVVVAGLVRALEEHATVYVGTKRPEGISCIMICAREEEDELSERIKQFEDTSAHSAPILVFGSHLNLPLARDALRAGASGFVHAGMTPDQLVRAVSVAIRGETVAPRQLLGYLLDQDEPANLGALSARQREILGYVAEGLSNAEIASALFLSESTIKQHLRAAYKLIGASNRTEAAKLFRRDG